MIKAVFFDLYHTLVTYRPSQAELEAAALKELGVTASSDALRRPIIAADEFIYEEIARRPLSLHSREEKGALYARYQETVLREAKIPHDNKLVYALLGKMQQIRMNLALFDDVIPTLTVLKEKGLTLGLISNIEEGAAEMLERLGLTSRLDVVMTSRDAGVNKPDPGIFRAALQKAGVKPEEAIYTGDQYRVDVLGARGAGLTGILLDRYDYNKNITDCPRIKGLQELEKYVK
jgi:putative hydrolase of the HAD superfamily